MATEILTDEMAAAIWSGDTASIAELEPKVTPPAPAPVVTPPKPVVAAPVVPPVEPKSLTEVKDEDLNNVFSGEEVETEEELENEEDAQGDKKIVGRKVSDLVSLVNELIDEDVLLAQADPEDDTKIIKPKNIAEAKALLKRNLEEKENASEEVVKKKIKESYSPQIQAVLQYAEQGAQSATELMELLGAIKEVEDTGDYDISKPEGAVNVITESLKARGLKDAFIQKQINMLKDLGDDKLKEQAEELLPELEELKAQKVEQMIRDRENRNLEAQKASKIYLTTIQETLQKETLDGVRLEKGEKAKIFNALAKPTFTSLSGKPTNEFVKTLEDLQFGENKNYEHFLKIVHLAIDPKGFDEKYATKASTANAVETQIKLRSAKSITANAEIEGSSQAQKRKLPAKVEFRNPFE